MVIPVHNSFRSFRRAVRINARFLAAQNDPIDSPPTSVADSRNDTLAILPAIETFDLPDIGFCVRVVQLLDGLDYKPWRNLRVISPFVSLDLFQLRLLS
jgi:hypothetical protein